MDHPDETIDFSSEIERLHSELRAARALAWLGIQFSTFGHEIANAIGGLMATLHFLRDQVETSEPLREITKTIDTLDYYATNLSKIVRLSRSHTKVVSINVSDFLAREEEILRDRYHVEVKISCQISPDSKIRGDEYWLDRCIQIICDNAARAMEHSMIKRITLNASEMDNQIYISFRDTGPGISNGIRDLLFKEPVPESEAAGIGIGLLIAKTICEIFEGSLALDFTGDQGTSFTISFPREL